MQNVVGFHMIDKLEKAICRLMKNDTTTDEDGYTSDIAFERDGDFLIINAQANDPYCTSVLKINLRDFAEVLK